MTNYIILFSNQDEWGKKEIEAASIEEALISAYGEELTGVILNTREDGTVAFNWDDDVRYFTGIIIPSENLDERVYAYKHDFEELLGFNNLLGCYKRIACDLEEAYGLEEAMEVINFLINSTDNVLNINLESWGDTTIFIMD